MLLSDPRPWKLDVRSQGLDVQLGLMQDLGPRVMELELQCKIKCYLLFSPCKVQITYNEKKEPAKSHDLSTFVSFKNPEPDAKNCVLKRTHRPSNFEIVKIN